MEEVPSSKVLLFAGCLTWATPFTLGLWEHFAVLRKVIMELVMLLDFVELRL